MERKHATPASVDWKADPGARQVDPTLEEVYWSQHYKARPYYREGQGFDDYEPAYRYGWEAAIRASYRGQKFHEVEAELEKGWDEARGASSRSWSQAREAVRDAWERVRRA